MAQAGYSGTPLAKKLGLKAGLKVVAIDAPDALRASIASEAGVAIGTRIGRAGSTDVALVFVTQRRALEAAFARVGPSLQEAGALWVAWPKRASRVPTDITEDLVREVILPAGWVDNKVCAIDEVWSGLRVVRRLALRERSRTRAF